MKSIALPLLAVLTACASRPPSEARVTSQTHLDYASIRPIIVAVLPGGGEASRTGVRRLVYDRLIAKRYSPLSLESVDAHTDRRGTFSADDMEWDATLRIDVDRFKAYSDGRFYADATAVLDHRTGERLWSCSLANYPLKRDFDASTEALAKVIVDHFPDAPPLPR